MTENRRFSRVYIELTNVCNLDCSFCLKTKRPPHFLPFEQFCVLANAIRPYTDYIYLHLIGEPLLHPQLCEILAYCHKTDLKVNLTTNGTLLKDVKEIIITAKSVRKIAVSLHSFEANSKGILLDRYLDDVFEAVHLARAAGIISELRLWNGGGAEALNSTIVSRIGQAFNVQPGGIPNGFSNRKLGERLYLVFAPSFEWPSMDAPDGGEAMFCRGLRDHFGILCDGTVVPCCLDGDGVISLGNALERPLSVILNSPRAKAIYNGFSQRRAVEPLCQRCGYARRF
ncbi:radical SAM protein [Anaerotruncus colihominis]|uniref:Radical SAM/SPASM domain-containing protein n=2 Tax=Anaerotruncus colihominis TaxID=169435 RepID=A0A845RDI3_9FIRM|nr:radical SAM/SPASM domain-containing protein [Anaerotruncus colihominis]